MLRLLLPILLVMPLSGLALSLAQAQTQAPPQTQDNPLFEGYTAHYDVSRNGISLGVTSRYLSKHAGNELHFTSKTEAEGFVSLFVSDKVFEESVILYKNGKLQPMKYTYRQTGGSEEKHVQIHYDWSKKRLSHSQKPEINQLVPNSHDLLSFQLALIQSLSQDQHAVEITIIDHKRVRSHALKRLGEKSFETNKGKLKTIHMGQQKTSNPYRFSFWCAPSYHYLPVVIKKIEHDGDVVTLKLRQLNGKPIRFLNPNEYDD